jgi:uncharacterized protein YxeA
MKKILVLAVIIAVIVAIVVAVQASPTTQDSTAELVKAMNIQNKQLDRIAVSLERSSAASNQDGSCLTELTAGSSIRPGR